MLMNLGAIVVATSAAVNAFGWWHGLGIGAALYVLMPYHPKA